MKIIVNILAILGFVFLSGCSNAETKNELVCKFVTIDYVAFDNYTTNYKPIEPEYIQAANALNYKRDQTLFLDAIKMSRVYSLLAEADVHTGIPLRYTKQDVYKQCMKDRENPAVLKNLYAKEEYVNNMLAMNINMAYGEYFMRNINYLPGFRFE